MDAIDATQLGNNVNANNVISDITDKCTKYR